MPLPYGAVFQRRVSNMLIFCYLYQLLITLEFAFNLMLIGRILFLKSTLSEEWGAAHPVLEMAYLLIK
jgi:hypothetical protein